MQHIHSIECSRSQCGMLQHLIIDSQQSRHTLTMRNQGKGTELMGRVYTLACRRKPECQEKIYQGGHGIGKPNSRTTTVKLHWWKEIVWALNQPGLSVIEFICIYIKSQANSVQFTLFQVGLLLSFSTVEYQVLNFKCRSITSVM